MNCINFKELYVALMILLIAFFWLGAIIHSTILSANKKIRAQQRVAQGLPVQESVEEFRHLFMKGWGPIGWVIYFVIWFSIVWSNHPWRLAVIATLFILFGYFPIKLACN